MSREAVESSSSLYLAWCGVVRDARYALRSLGKSRGFTCTALLILALCVGANAAVFSLLYALVLRPLPLPDADRLVKITNAYPKAGIGRFNGNVAQYLDYAANADDFDGFALYRQFGAVFPDHGAVRTNIARVTPDLFSVLGVAPLQGTFFAPEQSTPGKDLVLVITQSFWESYYHGDTDVVGRTMAIGDSVYTIVGVASRGLETIDPSVGVLKPLPWRNEWVNESTRHSRGFTLRGQLYARLKPGVSLEQAHARLTALDRRFYQSATSEYQRYVDDSGHVLIVETLLQAKLGSTKRALYLLQGAAMFVLLIGSVNIANLLLARANARQSSVALRSALGASRGLIARQLMVESSLLALGGCVLGVGAGWAALKLVNQFALPFLPEMAPVGVAPTMLGFALIVSLVVGVVIGTLPVAHLWRVNLLDVIRRGTVNASQSRGARAAGSILVSGQVALSLVLLSGTGLLLQSFTRAMAVEPGMEVNRVVTLRTGVRGARFRSAADVDRLQDRILDGMRRIAGVEAVALATHTPTLEPYPFTSLFVYGAAPASASGQPTVQQVGVSPDYFETLGIPILRGRTFDLNDDAREARNVIVDQRLADEFFPQQDPIGRKIGFGRMPTDEAQWMTIVGVVGTVRYNGLDEEDGLPFAYFPVRRFRFIGHSFFARSSRAPGELLPLLREQITAADSQLPPLHSGTVDALISGSLQNRRSLILFLGLFAALAVVLAAIGIYGVLACDVTQRTREIGIRGAVGATRPQILALFLRQGLWKTGIGIALGMGASLVLNRLMTSLLFEVSPYDAANLTGTALLLLGIGLGASVVPAWRAARVDPVIALRTE